MKAATRALVACSLMISATIGIAQQPSSWTISSPKAQANGSSLAARGEEAYQARCIACHGRTAVGAGAAVPGPRKPGTEALETRYKGQKPAALEDRSDLTPEFVRFYVRNGSGIMPFFRKTEVSDSELEAIAAYLSRH